MTTSERIAKLTTRELPHKSKNAKITVREHNGLYSTLSWPCINCKKLWLIVIMLNALLPVELPLIISHTIILQHFAIWGTYIT